MSGAPALKRIWLCADDYGISKSVDTAIRDLATRGRLNATSVMVVAPAFDPAEAASLDTINAGGARVAIGLHLTLTAPFRPLSAGFAPLREGAFLSIGDMLFWGFFRGLRLRPLTVEIAVQLRAFVEAFGRPPDFIDGHQHVHLIPPVREALFVAMKDAAPNAWVRQCGRVIPWSRRLADRKGLVLDLLSAQFRSRAAKLGIAVNPAFAGTYDFTAASPDFPTLFPRFLERLPEGSVVMCHPGFVDDELTRLDPLTTQRTREYEFLAGDSFPGVLQSRGVTLA